MDRNFIKINSIIEGFTPRQTDERKEELRDSIAKVGLLEPLLVRKNGSVYEIIDGIRRFRAVKELGWKSVECRVIDAGEEITSRIAYVRNTERRNFSILEDAIFLQSVKERFGYNNEDLVRQGYALHRATIDNKLSLLDLPEEIRDKITHGGPLTASKGYEIARIQDEDTQRQLASEIEEKGLSCREIKDRVRSLNVSRKRTEEEGPDPVEIPAGQIPGVYFKDSQDMAELADGSVGLVVTSPPYGVGMEYEKGVSFEDHLKVLDGVFKECVRVLVPGGKICVNVGDILTYGSRVHGKPEIELIGHHIHGIMHNHGMRLRDRIIWEKGLNWVNNPQVSYHRKIQHTSYRILNNFEYIFVFEKEGKREVPFDVETESKISKEEWKSLVPGVWNIRPVCKQKDHPAQFPEELPRRLIQMYSYKGDLVLDCFGGTMTTVKVARELGRKGVGYEKNECYKSAIIKKLGITEEDLKNAEPVRDKVIPSGGDPRPVLDGLKDTIAEVLNASEKKNARVSRVVIPLKGPVSKEDVEIEWAEDFPDPAEPDNHEPSAPVDDTASPLLPAKCHAISQQVNKVILGDCLEKLKDLPDDSVDLLATDPPYGIKFMGKDWDNAVPKIDIWKQCLRVLKPGALMFVMSASRQDCLARMIVNIENAGFKVDSSSLYWTYATGISMGNNVGKAIDKKFGAKRKIIGRNPNSRENCDKSNTIYESGTVEKTAYITEPATPEGKKFSKAYKGFRPKPAVEVVIVAMKPIEEKTLLAQALKNGKGIAWLDDCRIPYEDSSDDTQVKQGVSGNGKHETGLIWERKKTIKNNFSCEGRFPANLLISDDVLQDNRKHPGGSFPARRGKTDHFGLNEMRSEHVGCIGDKGGFSRYFSLDAWVEKNLPFLIVPKPCRKEKDAGCEELPIREKDTRSDTAKGAMKEKGLKPGRNVHPTVKPVRLMSYLITMGSREGDVVLDPFCGSGTTCVAAKILNRKFIGFELNEQYHEIAEKRVNHAAVAKAA